LTDKTAHSLDFSLLSAFQHLEVNERPRTISNTKLKSRCGAPLLLGKAEGAGLV